MLKRIFAVCGLGIMLGGCASSMFGSGQPRTAPNLPHTSQAAPEENIPLCSKQSSFITFMGAPCRLDSLHKTFPFVETFKPQ